MTAPFDFTGRTEMLVGAAGVETLAKSRVAVFGIGGVGGFVCEALARAGVGMLTLFDDDRVVLSNTNRQLTALCSTMGRPKAGVMAERVADINPACHVTVHQVFYLPENAGRYPLEGYDYVVDAVDTVSAKLEIIRRAKAAGVPVISAMGAGNKLRPEAFVVADIEETSTCPLARVMRKELRKQGITGVKVVYSTEEPMRPPQPAPGGGGEEPGPVRPGVSNKPTPGSAVFTTGAAGLLLAAEVVCDLLARG